MFHHSPLVSEGYGGYCPYMLQQLSEVDTTRSRCFFLGGGAVGTERIMGPFPHTDSVLGRGEDLAIPGLGTVYVSSTVKG